MPMKLLTACGAALLLAFAVTPTWTSVEAQAPSPVHPSVVFAAAQLKGGLLEDALTSLRTRIEAAPDDCQALGLMTLAYLQQHDTARTRLWLERLTGLAPCAQTAAAVRKVELVTQ